MIQRINITVVIDDADFASVIGPLHVPNDRLFPIVDHFFVPHTYQKQRMLQTSQQLVWSNGNPVFSN